MSVPIRRIRLSTRGPLANAPSATAELTRAYVAAGEAAGLLTTAKHFPGHGSTERDSHDSLPVAERSIDELRACELYPFKRQLMQVAR